MFTTANNVRQPQCEHNLHYTITKNYYFKTALRDKKTSYHFSVSWTRSINIQNWLSRVIRTIQFTLFSLSKGFMYVIPHFGCRRDYPN